MRSSVILCLGLLLFACTKPEEKIDTSIPTCIKNIIDDPALSVDLKTLRVAEGENELHYWLNSDHNHFDGPEYIVNAKCDTVCVFCGFCILPECHDVYDGNWTIIWTK